MSKTTAVVFLFDVDNTLLDNDLVQSHLKEHLADAYGASARDRYWDILEGLRSELGYVDYLGALERFRVEEIHRPEVLRMSNWLVDYPFADRLYPANHYVLIDDKLHILAAVKKIWGERVTTVFAKQGHYAFDPKILAENPPADIELAKIGDLLNSDLATILKKR